MNLYFLKLNILILFKLYASVKIFYSKGNVFCHDCHWIFGSVKTLFFFLRINIYFVIAAELFDLVKTLLIFIKLFY